MESALYVGHLRHRRFTPRPHAFRYPVYMAFLDIDRLPELMRASPLSSYNRWNLTAYCEGDHFGARNLPLRARLAADAASRGLQLPDGQIFLLTHLRYLGYVFNPVSFYYFYDGNEKLAMLMAEVNSTFGERHNYWLTADQQRPSATGKRYLTPKAMHVSPFMSMHCAYEWIFSPPGEHLVAHMNTIEDGKPFFDATLELDRHPWHARALHRTLAAFPFMTARVIVAIHWQALRLWLKKIPVFTHPSKKKAGASRPFREPARSKALKGTSLG
ncbi:MAG: DUF1365 domain-containing protein [Candidatus Acidiferrum sp.]|jgi:hypothetical protein